MKVYNFFEVTEKNTKFKHYQGYNDGFPWHYIKPNKTEWPLMRIESEVLYENVEDEIKKALGVSDNSDDHLLDETTGPPNIKEY